VRISAGKCKGRVLASFRGMSIRPTSDKVREAIFNILPRDFPFKSVLDIFAGTGALGIEALSRGAQEAVFVDSDPKSVELVRKNLVACALTEHARVFKRDALGAVRYLRGRGMAFDLVFIDPPYASTLAEETLKAIAAAGIVEQDGIVVAETSKRNPIEARPEGLSLIDERRYGETLVYFFSALAPRTAERIEVRKG